MLQDIVVGEWARDEAKGQNAQENIEDDNTPVSLLLSFSQSSFFQKSLYQIKKKITVIGPFYKLFSTWRLSECKWTGNLI